MKLLLNSLLACLIVFISGISANNSRTCLENSSEQGLTIERNKQRYSWIYGSKLYQDLITEQKLVLCIEVFEARYFDLAEKFCFGENLSELSTNDMIGLRLLQGSIHLHSLKFGSAIHTADLAIELIDLQMSASSKNADDYKRLGYLRFLALLDKLISVSYMEGNKNEVYSIDTEIQKILPTLPPGKCPQAKYLDRALDIFPERTEILIGQFLVTSVPSSCSDDVQNVVSDYKEYRKYAEKSEFPKQFVNQLERRAMELEGECKLEPLITVLINLSRIKLVSNPDESLKHIEKVERIAGTRGEKSAFAEAHWTRAIREALMGKKDVSIFFFDSACSVVEHNNRADFEEIFGGFSFLNDTNTKLVNKAYSDSICAKQ